MNRTQPKRTLSATQERGVAGREIGHWCDILTAEKDSPREPVFGDPDSSRGLTEIGASADD